MHKNHQNAIAKLLNHGVMDSNEHRTIGKSPYQKGSSCPFRVKASERVIKEYIGMHVNTFEIQRIFLRLEIRAKANSKGLILATSIWE